MDRAKAAAEKYGIPHVFENYEEMLDLPELDAIDICTPNYLHSIIAVKALNKGLHVFSEKPDAVSVEEVEKMQAAAAQSGKTLMVMRNNRYWETSKYLKQYIQDGKMGDIRGPVRMAAEAWIPGKADGLQRRSNPEEAL
ncbi:MAG: Gfo/Idh/MocA family protein [Clostridia bacterium]